MEDLLDGNMLVYLSLNSHCVTSHLEKHDMACSKGLLCRVYFFGAVSIMLLHICEFQKRKVKKVMDSTRKSLF
jgi:hypothetical protein